MLFPLLEHFAALGKCVFSHSTADCCCLCQNYGHTHLLLKTRCRIKISCGGSTAFNCLLLCKVQPKSGFNSDSSIKKNSNNIKDLSESLCKEVKNLLLDATDLLISDFLSVLMIVK